MAEHETIQQLRAEVAELRAKLSRPRNGRAPNTGCALTDREHNRLKRATARMKQAWLDDEQPEIQEWVEDYLANVPEEIRALRPDVGDWVKLLERYAQ